MNTSCQINRLMVSHMTTTLSPSTSILSLLLSNSRRSQQFIAPAKPIFTFPFLHK